MGQFELHVGGLGMFGALRVGLGAAWAGLCRTLPIGRRRPRPNQRGGFSQVRPSLHAPASGGERASIRSDPASSALPPAPSPYTPQPPAHTHTTPPAPRQPLVACRPNTGRRIPERAGPEGALKLGTSNRLPRAGTPSVSPACSKHVLQTHGDLRNGATNADTLTYLAT